MNKINSTWEAVIGLEIHAQLSTESKLFSSSSTQFDAPPNSHVSSVDMGLPGSLPVLNQKAVEMAVSAGLALNCTINPVSIWSRKHYFYPDLPKGYQISQYDRPLCSHGSITIVTDQGEKKIGITRIHMEEDAGKNIHEDGATWTNLNRAGIPLIEIVSEPDMRTAQEAGAYMRKMRALVRAVGVCDGNMEQGSLRCDVNVSIRKQGATQFGTKVELKNINSFRFVEKAIEFEIQRQTQLLEDGGTVVQETRSFDSSRGITFTMRKKEDAHDYRYFPEPDLPPLRVGQDWIDRLRSGLPELPDAKRKRFMVDYALPAYDADVLTASAGLAQYFEKVCKTGIKNFKQASNWIMTAVLRDIEGEIESMDQIKVAPQHLGEMLLLIETDVISGKIAKTVFDDMLTTGKPPKQIVDEKGLVQITDTSFIEKEIEAVFTAHPQELKDLLEGKDKLVGFFIGQLMKATKGKANPQVVQQTFKSMIDKRKGST